MKKISRKSFLKLAAATTAGTAMAPALMGCAWPDTQDRTPYKGDIVLLLSNDIHSNLGTSKIMSTDGSTRITGGVARMAAAQAGVRHRAFGKTLTLDGGDYSQGTPYQDGYQKGWEILALAEMQVDFCTLGNHEFDLGQRPEKPAALRGLPQTAPVAGIQYVHQIQRQRRADLLYQRRHPPQ